MTKILFLAANPSDTTHLQIGKEHSVIEDALRLAEIRDFKLVERFAVRNDDLATLLLRHKPDIVHFSGHGNAAGEIVLEDENGTSHPVPPQALRQLFRVLKDNIRCVILNACYSESQAEAIAQEIACVIGMSQAVEDESSIAFSKAFYITLAAGKDVQTAFDTACTQIALDNRPGAEMPKLFGNKETLRHITFRAPKHQAEKTVSLEHQTHLLERMSAIVAAAACLGILSFLLIRGKPFEDQTLAVIARTFMSLAAAIFGATIPGFLSIRWSRKGLGIRASGALALFLLTYLGTPQVASGALQPPNVDLQVPNVIDIRSFNGAKVNYEQRLAEKAVVIARMTYTNDAQPAKNAFLKHESVSVSLGALNYQLKWLYIVNLFPGAGCWPCIKESVSTMTIPSGGAEAHETLFDSAETPTWGEFLQEFMNSPDETATFTLVADVDGQNEVVTCVVTKLSYWRDVVTQWHDKHQGQFPAKLTLPCERPLNEAIPSL